MLLWACADVCVLPWAHVCACGVQEASISWEKRQAEVRAKLQQDTDAAAWNSWWENLGGKTITLVAKGMLFFFLWLLSWARQSQWSVWHSKDQVL